MKINKLQLIFLFFISLSWFQISVAETPAQRDCAELSARECQDNTALFVIDMQPYFAEMNGVHEMFGNDTKLANAIQSQIEAIRFARKSGIPIVFIEYECDGCDAINAALMNAVEGYDEYKVFKKSSDGVFDDDNKYKAELLEHLDSLNIDNIIITGANGGACVKDSILGAINYGYDVLALNPAIADFNFMNFITPYSFEQYWNGFKDEVSKCANGCSFQEYESLEALRIAVDRIASLPFAVYKGMNQQNRATPVFKSGLGNSTSTLGSPGSTSLNAE